MIPKSVSWFKFPLGKLKLSSKKRDLNVLQDLDLLVYICKQASQAIATIFLHSVQLIQSAEDTFICDTGYNKHTIKPLFLNPEVELGNGFPAVELSLAVCS